MSTLALIIMSLATAVKASTYQNRTELATYDEIYSAVMDKGLKVQYELNISAFNFGPISADLTNIEWFSNYSVNAQLHGNREYMAFSEIEPTFLGLNESWPYHISDNCVYGTIFYEIRLFKSPGSTSAELFALFRDDSADKILKVTTINVTVGDEIRLWVLAPTSYNDDSTFDNKSAVVVDYNDLKTRIGQGITPVLAFRYADAVNGDQAARGYISTPVMRLIHEGTDMERVETVLNVLTFYGPDTKVQDWGRITYYKKEQTVVGSDGTTYSFDVLVQARVEVLMGSDPDLGLTGDVIENNAFFLRWGETAWIWDHYSG